MKWFTYLKRTPLAQIRADWSEYMGLWRKCATLRGLRNAAYNKIIRNVNGDEQVKTEPACIVQTYYYTKVNSSSNDGLDNMMWITQAECEKFRKSADGVKCEKSDCPYFGRNHEYADACSQYNLIRQARRAFWRVKFTQAVQHTK